MAKIWVRDYLVEKEELLVNLAMNHYKCIFLYRFFVNDSKISSSDVQKHLKISDCSGETYCIKRKSYGAIRKELKKLNDESDAKIWVCKLMPCVIVADKVS